MKPFSFLPFVLLLALFANASQARSRGERTMLRELRADVSFLASDALEGRRAGTEGARKAADYIIARYKALGISPYGKSYRHPFSFTRGYELGKTSIALGGLSMQAGAEVFPFPFSANGDISGDVLIDVQEQGSIWTLPLYANADEAADPHFETEKAAWDKAKEATTAGAAGVLFYDPYGAKYPPEFNRRSDFETLSIPVAFASHKEWQKLTSANANTIAIRMSIHLSKPQLEAENVVAFINNKAPLTVVIGAHYDHLGHGEDGGSLYTGANPQIHNGADDNASGTAALLQMAEWLQQNHGQLHRYNYLFAHFSGEELGLLGSKALVKQGLDSSRVAYMINMDMVGRLVDSTSALTVGGLGTSPAWGIIPGIMQKNAFRLNVDSSGAGPSDHTSFYNHGVPVLFFFTGIHRDYHKPSDDADKLNYEGMVRVIRAIEQVIAAMDKVPRPQFTPTKQSAMGRVRFKVTLGIMPDYAFQGEGLRVDGVIADRPAAHAGILPDDIIIRLGRDEVRGMQSYMEALSHQQAGNITDVIVLREGKQLHFKVQL